MRIPDPTRKEFHKALVEVFVEEMELLLGLDFKPIQKIMIPSAHIGQDLLFLKIIEQMENDDLEVKFAQAAYEMKPANQKLYRVTNTLCNGVLTPPTSSPPDGSSHSGQTGEQNSPVVSPSQEKIVQQAPKRYDYDAYISFNRADEKWVRGTLINMLNDKDKDLKICTDADLLSDGAEAKSIAKDALRRSKKLLPVFSPA